LSRVAIARRRYELRISLSSKRLPAVRPIPRGPANAVGLPPCVGTTSVASMAPEAEHLRERDNGAWKHGGYSQAARIERFLVKRLLKDASSLRTLLSKGET
jgi:hypothetical protein